jgi:uncharacterized protein
MMWKIGFGILLVTVLLYGLQLLAVAVGQSYFIFQKRPLAADYTFHFEHSFEEIFLSAGGARIHGLFFEPSTAPTGKVVLYLHGNRGNLKRWGAAYRTFTELGYAVLLIDYRGYGKSSGCPSEAGLYQDGEAAVQWLRSRYEMEDIVLYGRSLGSGVASYLASKYDVRLLILETPYDRLPHVVERQLPFPVPQRLFRHVFPNDRWLAKSRCPAYIFAGSRDKLIPLRLPLRLQPLLPSPAHFITIEGGGHRNLSVFAEYHFQLRRLLLP